MAAARESSNAVEATVKKSSPIQRILASIITERKREKRSDDGFVILNSSDSVWVSAFSKYFVEMRHESEDDSRDDLLFYVRKPACSSDPRATTDSGNVKSSTVDVFRKHSSNLPTPGAGDINWEESVYLNIILQQFEYTLTCAVCTRTGEKELQILKKSSQKVYASPSHRQMDSKGTEEIMTYPDIFFCVDNFDEAFSDIAVRDSEMVCVELVASDRYGEVYGVIFLGSIRYEALKTVFDSRNSLSAKMRGSFSWTQRPGSLGGSSGSSRRRLEFIRMRGPHNKGYAEMAIGRQPGGAGGDETPSATPPITPASTPDSEWPPGHCPSADEGSTSFGAPPNGSTGRWGSESNVDVGGMLRNGLRWGFTMKKSQSLTQATTENPPKVGSEDVEAKSISDELQSRPYTGFLGKSFGQAWHWFKEQRRSASVSLNAHVTYVTLPLHRIIEDVLDVRRQPVLMF